ncbi:DUF4974 domain-containing protein [Porifericola rhodea]|uniref:FecR family protein n=1 Tax=Porifericola rhodea TaxID=930972 RepID=UPI002666554B|nr:FecR domain-containing protein [Porifericola rhodea]WKN31419.1 DUF4974 domain-containing protein [Porifericola rhodea]
MNEAHFWTLLTRVLSGEASPEEQHRLHDILASEPDKKQLYDEAVREWKKERYYPSYNLQRGKQRLRHKLIALEESVAPVQKKSPSLSPMYLGLAASVSIILALALWWLPGREIIVEQTVAEYEPNMVEIRVPKGKIQTVRLPDSSKVWLNAGSSLSYDRAFKQRKVTLEGEAFFDVVRNEQSAFSIQTQSLEIKVLGTSFNVNEYEQGKASVAVASGLVNVQLKQDSSVYKLVEPTEGVRLSDSGSSLLKGKQDIIAITAWREGKLVFEDMSLAEILPKLERWYDVEIEVRQAALLQRKFSGAFQHETLESILEVMHYAACMNYQINARQVVLEESPCATE